MSEVTGTPLPISLEPAAAGCSWVVLHARPRCEKKAEEYCLQRGIRAWLPLRCTEHTYGKRVRVFWKPVFPGYLFCAPDADELVRLRGNRYVANLLEVQEPEQLLGQLRSLQAALQSGDALDVLPYIEEGRSVVVGSGPFKGVEGVITLVKAASSRIVINVDLIGQAVAMEVDSRYLEPAR